MAFQYQLSEPMDPDKHFIPGVQVRPQGAAPQPWASGGALARIDEAATRVARMLPRGGGPCACRPRGRPHPLNPPIHLNHRNLPPAGILRRRLRHVCRRGRGAQGQGQRVVARLSGLLHQVGPLGCSPLAPQRKERSAQGLDPEPGIWAPTVCCGSATGGGARTRRPAAAGPSGALPLAPREPAPSPTRASPAACRRAPAPLCPRAAARARLRTGGPTRASLQTGTRGRRSRTGRGRRTWTSAQTACARSCGG